MGRTGRVSGRVGASEHALGPKITSGTGATVKFTATGTDFFRNGAQDSTNKGTATANAHGTVSVKGSGVYTGGSGLFRGLRGSYTFTGTAPKPTGTEQTVLTLHVKGNARY